MTTPTWQTILPTNPISNNAGKLITTTRTVATAFHKRHDDVLKKLKGLECSPEFTARNFAASNYTDSTGRKLPEYQLTRDGLIFLVMGFNGKKAAVIKEAYINAFNELERQLHNQQQRPLQPPKEKPVVYPESFHSLNFRALVTVQDGQHVQTIGLEPDAMAISPGQIPALIRSHDIHPAHLPDILKAASDTLLAISQR